MNDLPVVRSPWRILILVLGFTFLYAPMLMLVIYSFNSSKLVTVWAGWSTRWYSELFHDDAMMSAVGLSLTLPPARRRRRRSLARLPRWCWCVLAVFAVPTVLLL